MIEQEKADAMLELVFGPPPTQNEGKAQMTAEQKHNANRAICAQEYCGRIVQLTKGEETNFPLVNGQLHIEDTNILQHYVEDAIGMLQSLYDSIHTVENQRAWEEYNAKTRILDNARRQLRDGFGEALETLEELADYDNCKASDTHQELRRIEGDAVKVLRI